MAESWWYTRRTRWTRRRQSILEAAGVTAHPEVLGQLRDGLLRTPRVLTHTEGHTRPSVLTRMGRSAGVLRPWHAGREASKNVGGPRRSWKTRGPEEYGYRESPSHGEGLDGSTPPGKATHPGHVGPDQHEPTSLRAIAHRARAGNGSALRGCDCNRGTGCGKTARPGLHGGRRVTGVPTVAVPEAL